MRTNPGVPTPGEKLVGSRSICRLRIATDLHVLGCVPGRILTYLVRILSLPSAADRADLRRCRTRAPHCRATDKKMTKLTGISTPRDVARIRWLILHRTVPGAVARPSAGGRRRTFFPLTSSIFMWSPMSMGPSGSCGWIAIRPGQGDGGHAVATRCPAGRRGARRSGRAAPGSRPAAGAPVRCRRG